MQRLALRYVPVADEVHRLQTGKNAEGRLFREIAEQGHYAGRTRPTSTRQGIYLAAPSGVLLASCNTRSAETMAATLRKGLAKWEAMSDEERLGADGDDLAGIWRWARRRPDDGLVLGVDVRDLPRARAVNGWHAHARNRDHAWFTADEVRRMIPAKNVVGAEAVLPEALARRVAACHLIDIVRGQTVPWDDDEVREARITTTVTAVDGTLLRLGIAGSAHVEAEGTWHVGGRDEKGPTPQTRGVKAAIEGRAVFDRASGRFESFEMVAIGERWGGTRYNARATDLAPAPIGFAFTLADEQDRVAPAFIWRYGW